MYKFGSVESIETAKATVTLFATQVANDRECLRGSS